MNGDAGTGDAATGEDAADQAPTEPGSSDAGLGRHATEPGPSHAGPAEPGSTEPKPSRLATGVMAVGWAVILVGALGAYGKVHHFAGTIPWFQLGRWGVLLAVGHDLVVAPLVCLAGFLVNRLVPRRVQAPVAAALIVSAAVTLMAFPAVRGYGRIGGNISILPGNYSRGLLVVLAWVWAITIAVIVVQALLRARRARDRDARGDGRAARTSAPRPSTPR